jgi:hypothetical protein
VFGYPHEVQLFYLVVKLSLRERMNQPNDELAGRMAAARKHNPVTGSEEPDLVLDNRATLRESHVENTRAASESLVCFCLSCKQYKLHAVSIRIKDLHPVPQCQEDSACCQQ